MPASLANAEESRSSAGSRRRENYRLDVNAYDRASSLLVSLLVMAGVTILALLIIFFARRFVTVPAPIPVLPFDPGDRPADAALGIAEDIEPPGIEDAPELTEPKLMDTLNALTSELSSKVALLSNEQLDADSQVGKGSGLGDSRTAGGGGGGPEPRREFKFEFTEITEYARWYDHHKIELGAYSPRSPVIRYASNLSQPSPTVREGLATEEERFNLPSAAGSLEQFDRKLAEKAGLSLNGAFLLQFFPSEAYLRLLALEQAQAKKAGKKIEDIEQTTFTVVTRGSGFDFEIEEQLYY